VGSTNASPNTGLQTYPAHMDLGIAASNAGGPAAWITILVAGIAAAAAIIAAIVAALSARSTKRLELQAQRAGELESRISERKIDMYRPIIELFGNALSSAATGTQIAPQNNSTKIAEFMTWIAIYGSDDAIKTYHNFMQSAFANAPMLINSRLFAEFILAARRDIGYPSTSVTPLEIMGMRITDLYSEQGLRLAMSLPIDELFRHEKWTPPWLAPNDAKPDSTNPSTQSSS
jgi:hypothetical protein